MHTYFQFVLIFLLSQSNFSFNVDVDSQSIKNLRFSQYFSPFVKYFLRPIISKTFTILLLKSWAPMLQLTFFYCTGSHDIVNKRFFIAYTLLLTLFFSASRWRSAGWAWCWPPSGWPLSSSLIPSWIFAHPLFRQLKTHRGESDSFVPGMGTLWKTHTETFASIDIDINGWWRWSVKHGLTLLASTNRILFSLNPSNSFLSWQNVGTLDKASAWIKNFCLSIKVTNPTTPGLLVVQLILELVR